MSWDIEDRGRKLQIKPLAEKSSSLFFFLIASQITLLSYWQLFLQIVKFYNNKNFTIKKAEDNNF